MPTADPRPLTQRLKEDNWDLHEQAEHDALPQHMVKGTLPKDVYIDLIAQSYHIHAALDAGLPDLLAAHPELATLLGNASGTSAAHSPWYAEDLRHFDREPGADAPMPGVAKVVAEIEQARRDNPLKILGLHYVRQGATNGNRFVAMKLRPGYGLPFEDRGAGTVHLDPYGKQQRPLWDAFKTNLDAVDFTEDQKATVVAAAREMFKHIIALHKDMEQHLTPAASS
jgi:heme oxygenase